MLTDWGALKTDAIDMDSDFVWFDDNLFESEKVVLEQNYVLDGFFRMDPRGPEMAKKALEFLNNMLKCGYNNKYVMGDLGGNTV